MKITVDHSELQRAAIRLELDCRQIRAEQRKLNAEVVDLRNAWSGDDELHFAKHWEEQQQSDMLSQVMVQMLERCAGHLQYAAKCYQAAQIDLINLALRLRQ